jgi:capsular exopolysaccharide synthesis family protein
MSKFFNETLKARGATLGNETAAPETLTEMMAAALAPPAPPIATEAKPIEALPPIRIPVADQMEKQFKGSDSIESAKESYRALRTRLLRLRTAQGLRSILITSASQGEGKSLTAINLAVCCAQLHDMQVLLIDGDLRSRGLSRTIDSQMGPGLAEILAGEIEPEEAILATDLPNLFILGSGAASLPSAELFAGRRWQEFAKWCANSYKLILIDSPPVLNLADVELMTAACDGVLMVVRALHTKREALQKAASQIDEKKLLGAIYNAVETGARHSYEYTYGYPDVGSEKEQRAASVLSS